MKRRPRRKGLPLGGEALAAMVDRFSEVYRARIAQESRAFKGVPEMLDRLAAAGARLAVCTNKRTGLSLALLDAAGIEPTNPPV